MPVKIKKNADGSEFVTELVGQTYRVATDGSRVLHGDKFEAEIFSNTWNGMLEGMAFYRP